MDKPPNSFPFALLFGASIGISIAGWFVSINATNSAGVSLSLFGLTLAVLALAWRIR